MFSYIMQTKIKNNRSFILFEDLLLYSQNPPTLQVCIVTMFVLLMVEK
jgi:hypothetical protein